VDAETRARLSAAARGTAGRPGRVVLPNAVVALRRLGVGDARGELLVGADGLRSGVRAQFLADGALGGGGADRDGAARAG